MSLTRKQLLHGAAGGMVTLLVQGCGGGGGYGGGGAAGTSAGMYSMITACGPITITSNHGHTITISTADLDSTSSRTYSVAGTSNHDHTITLSPAQLAMLKAGDQVVVTSTVVDAAPYGAHSHDVAINCT
jgi:hypothetical protein